MRVEQGRGLRAYVRRQVYPYSAFNRRRLTAAGLGPMGVRDVPDLRAITPVAWTDVGDGTDAVLRPHRATITRLGSPGLAFRVLFATLLGRRHTLNRTVIDPLYRPIMWVFQDGVPVGWSASDLERLSELGRRWLEGAGIGTGDVVASVLPAGHDLGYWQLLAATRRAGIATSFLDPRPSMQDLKRLRPTVLAGRPADVLAVIEEARQVDAVALGNLHTVLIIGDLPDDRTRAAIERVVTPKVAVLAAWAPPGVRALWAECRGRTGFHTWPATEVIEVVDPSSLEPVGPGTEGEIIWTALGWAGTVVLRLRTGVHAVLDETPCASCGRTTPRVVPVVAAAVAVPFAPVLDTHPGVAGWQGELSLRNGTDELVVFVAPSRPGHPGRLVRDLDDRLRVTQPAAQFVVVSADELDRRLAQHDNNRVVDRRQ